jgi:hypothetical protein
MLSALGGSMLYVKSVLVGVIGAIAAAVLWMIVSFVLPLYVPMLVDRFLNRGGMGAASIGSGSIMLGGLLGFVIACWWGFRRFSVAP